MSRFTYDPLESASTATTPDTRAAANIASRFGVFETASADVNAENLAAEGLTTRALAADSHCERLGSTILTTSATFSTAFAGAAAQLVMGGSDLEVSGLSDLADGSALRIVAALWVSDITVPGVATGPPPTWGNTQMLRFSLRQVVSGTPAKIAGAEWYRLFTPFKMQAAATTVLLEAWIVGPLSGLERIEVWHQAVATGTPQSYTVERGAIVVDEFKRIEVL